MSDYPTEASQDIPIMPLLPPAPLQPAPLSPWVTVVCGAFVGAYLGFALFTAPPSSLDRLEQPEESLERLVTREMDLRAAVRKAPEWTQALYTAWSGDEETPDDVIAWYDELIGVGVSPIAQLYRLVLLAEDGQRDRVNVSLAPWEFQGESAYRMAQWVRAGYLGHDLDQARARTMLLEIRADLPPGWFADTLTARVGAAVGERAAQQEAEAAILARGNELLNRWMGLSAMHLALSAIGAMTLAFILSQRMNVTVAAAPLPPVWTAQDGYGLFIRGVFGFLLIGVSAMLLFPAESLYAGIATLAAGLPLVWWLHRSLAVRNLSWAATFGITLPAGGLGRVVGATSVVVALSMLGETAIMLVSGALHYQPHWADGLLENMLWGPPWLAACEMFDSVLWAPLVEELAFRGVLYATLRITMDIGPAAGLSAGIFALAHGYGAVGFASVFWSGLLWAAAYERTRSLLPAILAHMVNNLLVTTEFIWLLRL